MTACTIHSTGIDTGPVALAAPPLPSLLLLLSVSGTEPTPTAAAGRGCWLQRYWRRTAAARLGATLQQREKILARHRAGTERL